MAKKNVITAAKKKQAFALFQNNQLQDAKVQYARICELDPADAEAWFFSGIINGQLGVIKEAETCFRRAERLQPQRPEVHFNLGNILKQTGKIAEAETAYREALRLKPDFTAAHANLGTLLQDQGRFEEALVEHRAAARLAPMLPEVHFNLGNLLKEMGSFVEAESAFREALRLNPEFAEAHDNLGNVLSELQRFNEAVEAHRKALRLKPDFAAAYYNLGVDLEKLGWFPDAMAVYAEAVRIKPDYLNAWINWAGLLAEFGPREKALEYYRRAQSLDPMCDAAAIGEAWVLEKQGEFQDAYARLRPFLEVEKPDAFAAAIFAAICRPLNRRDEAIALMERVLERDAPSLKNDQRASLHFELGRLYDSKDAFDVAFRHYARGNEIYGGGAAFDAGQHARHIESLIHSYNHDFLAQAPRARTRSRRPVFIIGMPRSGTSLVEQILASHPEVFGGGELYMMDRIVYGLPAKLGVNTLYPFCLTSMSQSDVEQMAQRYLDHLTSLSPDAERVTDKMPGNFLHLGLINLLFPEARVIHCMRDPLDTCLSCYFQNFQWRLPYTQDLRTLGAYYRQYQRLMNHWKAVLDIAVMEVIYEELVADQEGISRAMIEFCDLKWDDRCLQFYDTKRVVGTASYDQVRRPMYRRSVSRWRNYESYLGPLKDALEQN